MHKNKNQPNPGTWKKFNPKSSFSKVTIYDRDK
jgi:hypothetical protein